MNNRARNILSSIILGIGTILLVSPFMLYWFIHGEYERYIWIINGPFPFSNFGSGPFQMGMYGGLFLIGILLLVAAFGIWKQKKLVSAIAFASIVVLIVLGVTSLSSFMYLYSVKDITPAPTLDSTEFASKIQNFVVQNFGQPIDSGFTAPMYLRTFPGLLEVDFDGVEASEGRYEYLDGELIFIKTPTGRYSTFDEAILEKGHETLLINIRGHLDNNFSVDELVTEIIAQGIGRVSGTILLGPTCPVVKDPLEEECADKPVFGTFIVKDIVGINEIARFGTQRDGTFTTALPAGEYSIESETPLGLGMQTHRIEVRAGETSKYTVTFDTGIR